MRAPPIGACSPPPRATARARSGLPLRRPRTQPTAPAPRARRGTRRATRPATAACPARGPTGTGRGARSGHPSPASSQSRSTSRTSSSRSPCSTRRSITPSATGTGGPRGVDREHRPRDDSLCSLPAPRRSRRRRAGPQPGRHLRAARATSSTRSSGIGSPPNSQITVRSLRSAWKQSPWSMAQMRPSRPSRQWPLLRSVLLATRSKAHIAAQRVDGSLAVLVEREVVLLEVGRRRTAAASPRRTARRRGATSAGTMPQPSASDSTYAATSRR